MTKTARVLNSETKVEKLGRSWENILDLGAPRADGTQRTLSLVDSRKIRPRNMLTPRIEEEEGGDKGVKSSTW